MKDEAVSRALALAEENQNRPVRKLKMQLKQGKHALRERYLQCIGQEQTPYQHWLCDNYYIIERESKQSIRALKGKRNKRLYSIHQAFASVFGTQCIQPTEQTIQTLLEALEQQAPLGYEELEFVALAVRTALLDGMWQSVADEDVQKLSHSIVELARVDALDFEQVIAACSRVNAIFEQDPAGVYPNMSKESKKHYRYLLAQLATLQEQEEQDCAMALLEQAQKAQGAARHIGYALVAKGSLRKMRQDRGKLYLALSVAFPVFFSVLFTALLQRWWVAPLLFLPLWELLRPLVQGICYLGIAVDFIPKMEIQKVPMQQRATTVVVSTLLPQANEAPRLKAKLEQLWFSNKQDYLSFCILADLKEAVYPTDPQDEAQIAAANAVVEQLNQQYGNRFMLMIRRRSYSETQNRYCGWERKRGAMIELVRLIKGEPTTLQSFVGDSKRLEQTKFLLALDWDTKLRFDTAKTMIAAALHPLNAPVIDPVTGLVTGGYGIFVPTLTPALHRGKKTIFSVVMDGTGGVSSYDVSAKEPYWDLFGESIFTGKGLLVVDAFYHALGNKLPVAHVLSHDILEGAYLRTAFLSQTEMTDASPTNLLSWNARMHRWVRGDWQNSAFLFSRFKTGGAVFQNPINPLSKYKLWDNLRRSLTPIACLCCLVAGFFVPYRVAVALAAVALLCLSFSAIWAGIRQMMAGGLFVFSRKFFTGVIPKAFEELCRAFFAVVFLVQNAFVSADAILRTLFRLLFSHKNLLEWTTAAQSEGKSINLALVAKRMWPAELAGLAFLVFAPYGFLRGVGLLFALALPLAAATARPAKNKPPHFTAAAKDKLLSYCAAMLGYFEEYATSANNFLPPDNVQQSPVFREATRTSPTNIGMMLLSLLVARDFNFIHSETLFQKLNQTLSTVEKLEKWQGNLYNWYDTQSLALLEPRFVSTVDSGNLVCCLVALKEGLREYAPECPSLEGLILRVEKLIAQTDLSSFYCPKRNLFSIGYHPQSGVMSDSHYDFLMSEARMTSYFAIAARQVDKKHWSALNRTMSKCKAYTGPVSWTGTMFEYFMPHLLLPIYSGSLLDEALEYCFFCQKKRTKGAPWGISESAYYAFDNALNYQYKAHGVQKIGVKRHLEEELVLSPYSSFLCLQLAPQEAMKNLEELEKLGLYGRYGFYEAADFTHKRIGGSTMALIRSYMSHHIGMSLIAACNALLDGKMQQRFMRDNSMKAAKEFLQEKVAKDAVVFESMNSGGAPSQKEDNSISEAYETISPSRPRCAFLSNGELAHIITDTGAGYLTFGGVGMTRKSTDLLRRPLGIFAFVQCAGSTMSATPAPFYDKDTAYNVEFCTDSVAWQGTKGILATDYRHRMHTSLSCQQSVFSIHNRDELAHEAQVLFYLEPILARYEEDAAHPAFSKLFVLSCFHEESGVLLFSRKSREDSQSNLFVGISIYEPCKFEVQTRKDLLFTAPLGFESLLDIAALPFGEQDGTPDAVCALRVKLQLPANGRQAVTLLVGAASSENEVIESLISMKNTPPIPAGSGAASPVLTDTIVGRLAFGLLPALLCGTIDHRRSNQVDVSAMQGQSELWKLGISGDIPIVIVESENSIDVERCQIYLQIWQQLRLHNILFDCALLYHSQNCMDGAQSLESCIKACGAWELAGQKGGVFVVDTQLHEPQTILTLKAAAAHLSHKSMVYLGKPVRRFVPMHLRPMQPAVLEQQGVEVHGGSFVGNRFYCKRTSALPYTHILANCTFGTLLSDHALGYSWAINARENKLTPWLNDAAFDNRGELLVLESENRFYDLVAGSLASFCAEHALYEGRAGEIAATVQVRVPQKGSAKQIEVSLQNLTEKELCGWCAYYIEPVLGVDRTTARFVCGSFEQGALLLHNPYQKAVSGYACMYAKESHPLFAREAFLSGNWQEQGSLPNSDPCAALLVPYKLPPKGRVRLRFVLSFGATKQSAMDVAALCSPVVVQETSSLAISTPDPYLNSLVNVLLPHQILCSRLHGRTAFYQCGGAYGFRDQLQDVSCYLMMDSALTKQHIYRCCAVQFKEGDVLHWWHKLPKQGGGLRGVRTRCTDDLLWLPYAVCEYLEKTGDDSILRPAIAYLEAPLLETGQTEVYLAPMQSKEKQSVYLHCLRAIHKAFQLGQHGLPLMGSGDWNDGCNQVGAQGKGESVWLGMFLAHVMQRFADVCHRMQEDAQADTLRQNAKKLLESMDATCWDGAWYLRAFYDDGSKMGSHQNDECAIDSLSQSFAAIVGLPNKQRVNQALDSVAEHLVDKEHRLVKLFAPPFADSKQQPGYVKAYPKGIRENGGQYTHAGVWYAMGLFATQRTEEGYAVLRLLNPAQRCADKTLAEAYKIEPYYIPADVYANQACMGRGGWSMYTGAASWYFRTVAQTLLGLQLRNGKLYLKPAVPKAWPGFEVKAVINSTPLHIIAKSTNTPSLCVNGKPATCVELDGTPQKVELHYNSGFTF